MAITGPESDGLTIIENNEGILFVYTGNLYIPGETVPFRINVMISNISISSSKGSGILCLETSLCLENISITDNTGGGIWGTGSNIDLTKVIIANNSTESGGGGISVSHSTVNLKNVTIVNNSAESEGGGMAFLKSIIHFSKEHRCNIYNNQASQGSDLYSDNRDSIIAVIVDTFTVLEPTQEHAHPLNKFTFDILNAKITDIYEQVDNLPIEFALFQNYPNPFNNATIINYQLPKTSKVELSIYNILGQKVKTLVSEKQPAGSYKVELDASGYASGVYMYRLETNKSPRYFR